MQLRWLLCGENGFGLKTVRHQICRVLLVDFWQLDIRQTILSQKTKLVTRADSYLQCLQHISKSSIR